MNEDTRKAMIEHLEVRKAELLATEDTTDPAVQKVIAADDKLISMLKQPQTEPEVPTDLQSRIELRAYLNKYGQGLQLDGAEAEMNQGLGLDSVTQIPWQALSPLEERTDDPTNVTIANWGKTVDAILPRIFEKTDAGFLGIATPGVPAGTQAYPVMTAGTSASMRSANQAIEADVATFTVETVTPTRLSARYLLNLEGLAAMGNMLESTLRSDLTTVMGDQFDEQLINGDGTAPNISGILNQLTNPSAVSAESTWQNYRDAGTANLDGKMARTESDIRILFGLDTWKHARSKLNTNQDQDGIQALQALGVSVQNSARIPDKDGTTNDQSAILTFEPAAAVAPVWQGVTVIRDPYSNADKAQVALTAHMLFGFVFKRTDGWKEIAFDLGT